MKIDITANVSIDAKEDGLWLELSTGIKHAMFNLTAMARTPVVTSIVMEIHRLITENKRKHDSMLPLILQKEQERERFISALKYYATPGQYGDVARKALGL